MLAHAVLQGGPQPIALPLGVHHVGSVGQVGGRVDEVAGLTHNIGRLARTHGGNKRHLVLIVDVAQALHFGVRQSAHMVKEAGVDVGFTQVVKQVADALGIARHRWT